MFNFIKRLEKVEGEVFLENSDNFLCPLAERVERLKTANNNLASRLILLESHLKLTYIPASEEKKEARYEEERNYVLSRIAGNWDKAVKSHMGDICEVQKIKKTCPSCDPTLKRYTETGGMGYTDSNGVVHVFGHGEGVRVTSGDGTGKIKKTKKK